VLKNKINYHDVVFPESRGSNENSKKE